MCVCVCARMQRGLEVVVGVSVILDHEKKSIMIDFLQTLGAVRPRSSVFAQALLSVYLSVPIDSVDKENQEANTGLNGCCHY